MLVAIKVKTGNWFNDGSPEYGNEFEKEIETVEELDDFIDEVQDMTRVFQDSFDYFVNEKESTISDIVDML